MIRVEFDGFVNRVREYEWGVAYDISHNQSKKQPDGTFVNDGKDYFSVVGVKGGPRFDENDFVSVKGTMKTAFFDKRDGSGKGVALNVQATEMVRRAPGGGKSASVSEMQGLWPEVKQVPDDNAPF